MIVQEIDPDDECGAEPSPSSTRLGIRSALAVALTVEEEPFGLFALLAETPDFFTTEYVEIAKEVAGQIALSLHQDRLNEQIRRHAQELEQRVAERTAEIQQLSSLQRTILEHADLGIISTTPAGIVQIVQPGCRAHARVFRGGSRGQRNARDLA